MNSDRLSSNNYERVNMYKHGVLTHFQQSDIEPIDAFAHKLGVPRSEFIRRACRQLINTMSGGRSHATPNASIETALDFHTSSGTGIR
jgi:metal-responsive CopG/Arc/MetJ family transcriptional regulator